MPSILDRYELGPPYHDYLCNRRLLRLKEGMQALPDDEETALLEFGGVLCCRIERHEHGLMVVLYNAD